MTKALCQASIPQIAIKTLPARCQRLPSVEILAYMLNKKKCFCTIVEKTSIKSPIFTVETFLTNPSQNPSHAAKTNPYP
jgi:hypothetical protein